METKEGIQGSLVSYDRPNWGPLCAAVGHRLAGHFMWMAEIELGDGTRIHAYKQTETRRYLHLDASGRAFDYRHCENYVEVAADTAIKQAFS